MVRTKLLPIVLLLIATACATSQGPEPSPSPSPTEATPGSSPTAGGGQSVQISLHSGNDQDCGEVVPVQREASEASLAAAMEQLLGGPTEEEASQGLGGWFSQDTEGMLISADIDGDVARVDFDDLRDVIPNASTSCGSQMLLAQLDQTAAQFDVSDTVYSIEGDPHTFYEWLQLSTPDL